MNKDEIKAKLTELGITFAPDAKVAELKALLPVAPEVSESQSKAGFKAIIEAYKVSNPAKYELKKEELAKKLANL